MDFINVVNTETPVKSLGISVSKNLKKYEDFLISKA